MGPTLQPNLQLLYNDARLAEMLANLDELHSAASEGRLRAVTPLSKAELLGWLHELLYTLEETVEEIEAQSVDQPGLTLVRKSS